MEEPSTRDKILKAMYQLIAEKGYDKASISQVCSLVGITKPSLYYYFPSKEELFLAVSESMWPTLDSFDESFLATHDAEAYRAYLDETGRSIIANYHDDEERRNVLAEIDLQATRIPGIGSQQKRLGTSMVDALTAMLQHGVDIGVFENDFDVHGNAKFLYVVLSGISQVISRHENPDVNDTWSKALNAVFREAAQH
ncbi:TetR/AcrR family transcriptional regulator [Eggerthella sinensis]|uniref:TetR/AcrR family transcriptional regulator n=2 Tax=Eggerthella sinensis TaxID=242230 RepID=A0A3N0IZW9_9ACTN|nr:TetR/AcrR family transcriptional regulator [Eggerthella sinensis]RDB65959.1 TetR/AcrR family transcriptional regulator [Eggerthella sinensis]RNM41980.1 TetR/AcrR family transcriptional regulator [Eggerthella sinensis]